LLPGAAAADAADVVCRLKALLDWSCFLAEVDGFDGEGNDTDEMEASDRRLAAADNTGISLLLFLLTQTEEQNTVNATELIGYSVTVLLLLLLGMRLCQ